MLQDSFKRKKMKKQTTQNKNKTNKNKSPKKGLALIAVGMSPLDSGLPSTAVCPGWCYPRACYMSWAASSCAELPCATQRALSTAEPSSIWGFPTPLVAGYCAVEQPMVPRRLLWHGIHLAPISFLLRGPSVAFHAYTLRAGCLEGKEWRLSL